MSEPVNARSERRNAHEDRSQPSAVSVLSRALSLCVQPRTRSSVDLEVRKMFLMESSTCSSAGFRASAWLATSVRPRRVASAAGWGTTGGEGDFM